MATFALAFTVTLLCGAALIATQGWHGHFSMDGTMGIQKHHAEPTPRIGGIALMLGLVAAWALANHSERAILGPMLLAGLPAFAFGLAEDVTKEVGVMVRLLATMSSGALAWFITGYAMRNTGVPPVDWLLSFTPLAVLFTAFAVGGVANAVNIIDGFNGLAAGAVAIMLAALGLIALNVGDLALSAVCFAVACCALGFGAINWPFGKLFLGDGGAYLLGFVLAWMAVLLPMRNPQLNAWTTLLVCAYPVLEVGFSVRRRQKREGHHPGQPDKTHLHHLLHRRVICRLFRSVDASWQNGLTGTVCWLFAALPAVLAIALAEHTPLLAFAFAVVGFGYAALYARLTQFRWCFSALTLKCRSNNSVSYTA